MRTQISILVKDESIFSKAMTVWFINIFKKSKVTVSIDGYKQTLKASKTPYVFDVAPGYHVIEMADPREKQKAFTAKMIGIFTFGAFTLAGGGKVAMQSAQIGAQTMRLSEKSSVLECNLMEGDNMRLSCKCCANAKVKIKQM